MVQVMFAEVSVCFLEKRIAESAGDGPLHELLHPVAHKAAHLVECPFGHAVGPQGMVGAGGQVAERGKQGAVKVEHVGVVVGEATCGLHG